MHAPTFMLANVIIDVEPLLVLTLGVGYPLHGYLHTFLSAFFLGLLLGSTMFLLERPFRTLYKAFLLETGRDLKPKSFMLAGATGTMLHVLLDSPLYDDIRPLYPLAANPFYDPGSALLVYSLCVWLGLLGIAYYASLLGYSALRRPPCSKKGTTVQL